MIATAEPEAEEHGIGYHYVKEHRCQDEQVEEEQNKEPPVKLALTAVYHSKAYNCRTKEPSYKTANHYSDSATTANTSARNPATTAESSMKTPEEKEMAAPTTTTDVDMAMILRANSNPRLNARERRLLVRKTLSDSALHPVVTWIWTNPALITPFGQAENPSN